MRRLDYDRHASFRAALASLVDEGLKGTFFVVNSWRDEDAVPPSRAADPGYSLTYGQWREVPAADAFAFLVDLSVGSDYSGGDITVANLRYLRKQYPAFGFEVTGGYSTYGFALFCDAPETDSVSCAEALYDDLRGLIDYPVFDEELVSEVAAEWADEAWQSWARDDFKRALLKKFGDEAQTPDPIETALDNASDSALRELFERAADRTNTYWETENADSTVDIDRVVNGSFGKGGVTRDEVTALAGS
jgi:hypothetical protein